MLTTMLEAVSRKRPVPSPSIKSVMPATILSAVPPQSKAIICCAAFSNRPMRASATPATPFSLKPWVIDARASAAPSAASASGPETTSKRPVAILLKDVLILCVLNSRESLTVA